MKDKPLQCCRGWTRLLDTRVADKILYTDPISSTAARPSETDMKYVARRSLTCVTLVLLVLTGSACSNQTGEAVPETDEALIDSEPVAMGELQYTIYCASCHGEDGKGDGPVAEALVARPTNLTLLKSINEGVFPADRLVAYIDGREDVAAHGTRQMPVWGNIWDEVDGKKVPEEEVQLRINELVEYIRSIQE